jgi:hypothetical protein
LNSNLSLKLFFINLIFNSHLWSQQCKRIQIKHNHWKMMFNVVLTYNEQVISFGSPCKETSKNFFHVFLCTILLHLDTLSPKLKSGRTNHTPTFFSFFKKIRVDIAKHELISVHQRPKDSSLPFKSSAFYFAKREQI